LHHHTTYITCEIAVAYQNARITIALLYGSEFMHCKKKMFQKNECKKIDYKGT